MKKLSVIALVVAVVAILQSCSDIKREPSRVYMPDMAYSRALETYADHHSLADSGIFYNAVPVKGTVKRGDSSYYELLSDTTGQYVASASLKNPLGPLDAVQMKEAERLYLVNCGICHGQALDGNGPLYKDGNGPYSARPANLSGQDAKIKALSDGTIFHVITYGKNLMGPYYSQVSPKQRWMIVNYIRNKQNGGAAPAAAGDSTGAAAPAAAPATTAPATTTPAKTPATN